MRCHTSCCSWKTRPPFSTSAPLPSAPSVIRLYPPLVTLLRYFSVHLTCKALPPFTLHGSGSLGESPWQPIHSDYVMWTPLFFSKEPQLTKKSWSTAETLPAEEWLHRADRSWEAAGGLVSYCARTLLPPAPLIPSLCSPPALLSSAETAVCC